MKSSITKVNSDFTIVDRKNKAKFKISKSDDETIFLYNEEIIEKVIEENINKKYRNLLYLTMNITEDDDSSESDTELALLKIENLKNLIISKYSKYLSKNLLNKYLKMLILLEEKLYVPKKGRGR